MSLLDLFSAQNIIVFIIVLTRLSGLITTAPLFSTYPIPPQVKVWLVALIAFIMYPMVVAKSSFIVPTNMIALTLFLIKEFIIGALIGFIANFIFAGVQMSGQFLSQQIGLAMSNVLDPATQSQVPVIGEFYLLLTTMLFLVLNAHQMLFTTVYQSFITIPPGINLLFAPAMVDQVLHLSSDIFLIALKVVLPIFCVLFVLEVLLGVLAKMIPQMNIFMVAIPVKIYVGLILMILFAPPMAGYLRNLIENHMSTLLKMFM